jgi:hypothetical protein
MSITCSSTTFGSSPRRQRRWSTKSMPRKTHHHQRRHQGELDERDEALLHRHSPLARTLARASAIEACSAAIRSSSVVANRCGSTPSAARSAVGTGRPTRRGVHREVDQGADRRDRGDRDRQLAVADEQIVATATHHHGRGEFGEHFARLTADSRRCRCTASSRSGS